MKAINNLPSNVIRITDIVRVTKLNPGIVWYQFQTLLKTNFLVKAHTKYFIRKMLSTSKTTWKVLRYYAKYARKLFLAKTKLKKPTLELNDSGIRSVLSYIPKFSYQ